MVARKPVPSPSISKTTNNPPYPTSPTMPQNSNSPDKNNDASSHRSRASSVSSNNTWNSGFSDDDDDDGSHNDIPAALKIGTNNTSTPTSNYDQARLPDSLRPGQQQQQQQILSNPWASEELQGQEKPQPVLQSHNPHNPYLRMQKTGQNSFNSQAAWGESSAPPPPPPLAPPPAPPVELPTLRTPTDEMAGMTLDAQMATQSRAPNLPQGLQPALVPAKTGSSTPSIERQHSGASSNPWQTDLDRNEQVRKDDTPFSPPSSSVPAPSDFQPSIPSVPRFEPSQAPVAPPLPPTSVAPPAPPAPALPVASAPLVTHDPYQSISLLDDEPPPQPPRSSEDIPPTQPPRPAPIDTSTRPTSSPGLETPMTKARRQRNETYQIKQINWFDASAGSNGRVRRSPIMTQNANGPCPLLALVNALTLSTPEDAHTALVDALSSREQVSLGLLLDAVFDELARRSEIHDRELPDVGDLYSFLITLHTGMNVNPRFDRLSFDTSESFSIFDETREMLLYGTFGIPLIHGWLPPPDSPIYAAFVRSANTFDDALNIQFREPELEEKLNTTGLTPEEQQLYEDIAIIKDFLDTYPTQLTEYGLDVISRSLKPGQIAIFFRNDHFSTLYKDPHTGALTTLVTDAGYSSHDEIVWESLVDVSGAANELFSGDFRPVGNSSGAGLHAVPSSSNSESNGWETVQSRNRNNGQTTGTVQASYAPPPGPPPGRAGQESGTGHVKSTEQEDHDLALALQLQEEEEDNERRAAAARRQREDELSRQFLDAEGHSGRPIPTSNSNSDAPEDRPAIPPRRSNLASSTRESAPSPSLDAPYIRSQDDSNDPNDQPPSYEQAASDRPFRPPGSQPRNSGRQGDALGALNAITAQQRAQQMNAPLSPNSAYGATNTSTMSVNSYGVHQAPPGSHRRRSSAMGTNGGASTNRMRRTQSQSVVAGSNAGNAAPGAQAIYGARPAGNPNSNMAAPGNRISQEEKCVVM